MTDASGSLDGNSGWNVCPDCVHSVYDQNLRTSYCNIPKVDSSIASFLTSIDVGADGHMASGTAILQCRGFQARNAQGEMPPSKPVITVVA